MNQNLQEGQEKVEEVKKTVTKLSSKSQTVMKTNVKVQSRTPSTTAVVTTHTETKHAKTTIKFCFTMESFVIDLLSSVEEVRIIFIWEFITWT